MSKANDNKNRRLGVGEYYITPQNHPKKTDEGELYWEVIGWRAWGGKDSRVRKRRPTWLAANTLLKTYMDGDEEWRKSNNKPEAPTVIVSKVLDEARLREATRALGLLPRLPDSHKSDPRYRLDDGINFALNCGWNPLCGSEKVADLSAEFQNVIRARGELPWKNEEHLSKSTVSRELRNQRDCVAIFGKESIASINSKRRQKEILDGLPKETKYARKTGATAGITRLLNYLVDTEKLTVARIYQHGQKSLSVPEAMTIPEQQAYLDEFWESVFAAAAVARLTMGVRPWSELGDSQVKDFKFGLSPDFTEFTVRPDAKTGWRPMRTPRNAQIMFERLDKEGRLSREKNAHGWHIIYVGHGNNWTYHYAKLGYLCSPSTIRGDLYGKTMEEGMEKFRKRYPLLHNKYFTLDYPRKTNITAYLLVSDGEMNRCATYHGNSDEVIEEHYRALMSRAAAVLHYRLIPTVLKGEVNPETIELPDFCTIKLNEKEQEEYAKLQDSLPKFTPGMIEAKRRADYAQRGIAMKAVWAARKGSQAYKAIVSHLKPEAGLISAHKAHEEFLKRHAEKIQALIKFCESHDHFKWADIDGILEAAGIPKDSKTNDWIRRYTNIPGAPFVKLDGLYKLARNGESVQVNPQSNPPENPSVK